MAFYLLQKHLLRYLLSRLEVLDTDALDLDSLGLDWGRRSTVELRDVGLRKGVSLKRSREPRGKLRLTKNRVENNLLPSTT